MNVVRKRRANRARARLVGNAACPRLSVFRSNRGMYVQLIDDARGITLAYASSREVKDKKGKTSIAERVGALVAERAVKAGVAKAAFDRGAYRYHGRVKAVAEGARAAGLKL
ncbi:MAG: 50S ribosomal protein L18 [Candidatus Liptonbacteria bacterium]|nr:50S ribosomal protein L18 [Candidatus Liptonbacteria bacterium]